MLSDEYKYQIPKESIGIMSKNVKQLRKIESNLREVFEEYEIEETIVPSFEYIELYKGVYEDFDENKMFKYIGRDGNVIALRWDFTIPIARQYFLERKEGEAKYSYFGKIYRKTKKYKGRSSEEYQAGIEIINKPAIEGDIECLEILEKSLSKLEVKDIKIELGSAKFFNRICELTGDKEKVIEILSRKNLSEMKKYVEEKDFNQQFKNFLLKLPRLTGDINMINNTIENINDPIMIEALKQLKETYNKMKKTEEIIFDLSMCPSMKYYTGLMFKLYTLFAPDAIISGGRYDALYENFGKNIPAIGMGYYINNILKAIEKEGESNG